MNVRELLALLNDVNRDLPVEVATSPRPDEWYEVYDTEILRNAIGKLVLVINTD